MSKTTKTEEYIYEDDFEKFMNEEIEEVIDTDEEFLKKLGFIADDEQKTPSDVSRLKVVTKFCINFHNFSIILLHPQRVA